MRNIEDIDFSSLARNIVNQLFDIAEVPAAKRQEINDQCDQLVIRLLIYGN